MWKTVVSYNYDFKMLKMKDICVNGSKKGLQSSISATMEEPQKQNPF